MGKLRFSATFTVVKEISEEFRKWMENVYFKEMEETKCFTPTVRRIFEENTISKTEISSTFDSVLYIHEPKSRGDWDAYQKHSRPRLRAMFAEKWGEYQKLGKINAVFLMGELEEI